MIDIAYILDILLNIGTKFIPNLNLPEVRATSRPMAILSLEILSVLPFELSTADNKLNCLLRLNRMLRCVNILYFYHRQRNLITSNVFIRVVELWSSVMFAIIITNSWYCNVECDAKSCELNHICSSYQGMTVIATKLTRTGFLNFPKGVTWELSTTILSLAVFLFVFSPAVAFITLHMISILYYQFIYVDTYNIMLKILEGYNLDEYFEKNCTNIFDTLWETRRGYVVKEKFFSYISPALKFDVKFDMYWPVFKHSKLLRHLDVQFLRYLSSYFKQKFLMPGNYVYHATDIKDKMIYLVSGKILLMSEEDDQTPIMSLGSGTCLGESSLIISYFSNNSVQCKTFCEFYMLYKKDFIRVHQKYPEEYRKMKRSIEERYSDARINYNLMEIAKQKLNVQKRTVDTFSMFWLKCTLHRLLSRNAESTYRHEFQNIYLIDTLNTNIFNRLIFTANFLSSMALTGRVEIDVDTVFVKSTFPCLLQPNSVVMVFWETVIVGFTIFLSIVIPFVAFISNDIPDWYRLVLIFSTLLFLVDTIVQLSRSFKTKQGGVCADYKTVMYKRIQTFEFWLDLISSFPLEVFSPIILSKNEKKSTVHLSFNRLLKIWRIEKLFRLWEMNFNVNVGLIRYMKFTYINAYTVWLICCVNHDFHESYSTMMLLFRSVQLVTGIGFNEEEVGGFNPLLSVIDILTTIVTIFLYAHIASAFLLNGLSMIKVQQLYKDLKQILEVSHIMEYHERLENYFNTQWIDNHCALIKYKTPVLLDLSEILYSEILNILIGDELREYPIFHDILEDVIIDMYKIMYYIVLPPKEFIIHSGDRAENIYILCRGTVEILNSQSQHVKFVQDNLAINVLEVCLDIPSKNTVLMKTHCKFAVINHESFLKILSKYPSEWKIFQQAITESSDLKEAERSSRSESRPISTVIGRDKSFMYFGYRKMNSFEESDYFNPFDRLHLFSFIRFFLARTTLSPHGTFLYCWEISRCVLGIASSFLFFLRGVLDDYPAFTYTLYFLNATAFVDMYVRMHVCYYDPNGVLISHPLQTSKHYLSNGFFIDLWGALPLDSFVRLGFNKEYFLLLLNKLLQMHRFVHFFSIKQSVSIARVSQWYGILYIPIMMVLCNFCGCLLVILECDADVVNGTMFQFCRNDSVFAAYSSKEEIMTPLRVHLYGMMIATSALTTVGMQGHKVNSNATRFLLIIYSIIGLYLTVFIYGKIITLYTYRQNTLLKYQELMMSLKKFLRRTNVDHNLRSNLIAHYEMKWKLGKALKVHELTQNIYSSLRLDLLYDYYGRQMCETSVFTTKKCHLYKSLIPYLSHDIITNGGYIITINDVRRYTYFIYNGVADVIAADGTVTDTLYPGSIFGNLENTEACRQHFSIVAMSHAEILYVKPSTLHKILKYYPETAEEYQHLKTRYSTYIPSNLDTDTLKKLLPGLFLQQTSAATFYFNPNNKLMKIWSNFSVVLCCYFGTILNFYQLSVSDFSYPVIVMQYTIDVLFLINMLVKDKTAYVDENGIFVTNLESIRKKNHSNKILLWANFISLIPIDVVPMTLNLSKDVQQTWFVVLRLNRVFRLVDIIYDYLATRRKLNISILLFRFGSIILFASLVISASVALMGKVSCSTYPNLEPSVPSCKDISDLPSNEKARLYIRFTYIVVNILTLTSADQLLPKNDWLIALFIIIMLIGHFSCLSCIGQIFVLLNDINKKKYRYRAMNDRTNYYLEIEEVSLPLIRKVMRYMELLWIKNEGDTFPKLLIEAPLYLKSAIMVDAFGHFLRNHSIFKHCHTDCLRQIVLHLRYNIYYADYFVQHEGAIDDTMYFIYDGVVKVYWDERIHSNKFQMILGTGDSFGVRQGLHERTRHEFSYKCIKETLLLSLNFQSWKYLLNFFPASETSIYNAEREYFGF